MNVFNDTLIFFGIEPSFYALCITLLTVFITLIQLVKHWVLMKGWLVPTYWLNILALTGYIILGTSIAMHDSAVKSLMIINVVNVWGIAMACKGLWHHYRKGETE